LNQGATIELSVVIPVYRCTECLAELHRRLSAVLSDLRHEIIFVDDGSPDGAWELLERLAHERPAVQAIRLSRNFGQQAAITAGLAHSSGRWVVVMDCDLQDPPEEVPRLIAKAREGYDIVFARRTERKHSPLRQLGAKVFFSAINFSNNSRLDGAFGAFSLISRKVVEAFLTLGDRDRHYLFILNWLGFQATAIDYLHAERSAGASSYTFRALIKHAFEGMFFQTTALLRWIVYFGFLVSSCGLLLAAYFVYAYFVHSIYPGWTSLAVLILLIGGFIISSTGISGLYVGKIFEQVKGRPLYVVDRVVPHR